MIEILLLFSFTEERGLLPQSPPQLYLTRGDAAVYLMNVVFISSPSFCRRVLRSSALPAETLRRIKNSFSHLAQVMVIEYIPSFSYITLRTGMTENTKLVDI